MDELDFDEPMSDETDIKPQELTLEQRELIAQYLEKWRIDGLSTESIDRDKFKATMEEFYAKNKLDRPVIVWLQDPWQVTALFSVLGVMQNNVAYILGRGYHSYDDRSAPLQKWTEKWLKAILSGPQWKPVWKVFDEYREVLYGINTPLTWEPAATANEKFYYPMFSECNDAIELFKLHYIENDWNELWNQAEFSVAWMLVSRIERPLRRFISEEFRGYHQLLSKRLDRQLRSQFLTEEDWETVKMVRTRYGANHPGGTKVTNRAILQSLGQQRWNRLKSSLDAVFNNLAVFDDLKFFAWQNSSPVIVSIVSALLPDHFRMSSESQSTHRMMQNFMENCFVFLPVAKLVLASDRPSELKLDQEDRLHCETGPALSFRSGLELYFWHGIRIPQWVIEDPERLSVQYIENEKNVEVRTALVERYGEAKFLTDSGAKVVHEDEYGTLYQKWVDDTYTLTMVKVTNSTANPDGTRTAYFLRVPNEVETAKEAVAWTFGLHKDEYNPVAES